MDFFKEVGPGNAAIFVILAIFSGGTVYWLTKILPKQMEQKEQDYQLLRDSVDKQQVFTSEHNTLLVNNTKAIEILGESFRMLCQTFEKVSDKMASHDERSIHITTLLQSQTICDLFAGNKTMKHT